MLYYNKKIKKNSKYNNIKTRTFDGIYHDSKKEAKRWMDLCLLQRAGEISGLRRQVEYELIPKQEGERAVKYIADFVYEVNGKEVVEDVKSPATRKNPEYVIKRKLMLYIHHIKIKEV
jgi:hypothetical protein